MRLGGVTGATSAGPEEWAASVRAAGYEAALCPVEPDADDATVRSYAAAAAAADVVIAEVIGRRVLELNLLDDGQRGEAIAHSQQRLDLADRIGARCCVGISGSRGAFSWAPSAENLTEETFALIIDTVREVIDGVKPTRTYYTREFLQWLYPTSRLHSPTTESRCTSTRSRPAAVATTTASSAPSWRNSIPTCP